jgi:hypothetical protein
MKGHVHSPGDRNLESRQSLNAASAVFEEITDIPRLPASVANGVASILHLEQCQFFHVRINEVGKATEQSSSVTWRNGSPSGKCCCCSVNGGITLRKIERRNGRKRLAGRWIDESGFVHSSIVVEIAERCDMEALAAWFVLLWPAPS